MNWSKDNLLQLYIEGNVPSEARPEFDRLVKEDPSFCELLVGAIALDIGAVPEITLDQMTARLDDRYDRIRQSVPGGGFKIPKIALPVIRLPKIALPVIRIPRFSLPAVRMPKMPWLAKIGPAFKLRVPQLPPISPEKAIFAGGLLLFMLLSLIPLTNPFQERVQPLEERVIRNFTRIVPVTAKRAVHRAAPMVRRVEKAPLAAKPSLPPPLMEMQAAKPAAPKTAQALVDMAFKSAPGGEAHPWVETTAPRAGAPAGQELLPLLPLPSEAEEPQPSSMTASGDTLRLAIPLDSAQDVNVSVADSSGRIVRNLYSGRWSAGSHTIDWDIKDNRGRMLKAGEYNILVETANQTHTQKVTIK
jgi:hypothetical protein